MSQSRFQDYFTNAGYIGSLNAMREHDASAINMGVVYVEDNSDVAFWKMFINEHFPNQYKLQTASSGVTGKRALEKLYSGANIHALIAVDSDYDYIKARYQSDHPFNKNPFILHTFGFSRENALIEKSSLQSFINKCEYTVSHNINLIEFMNKFTKLAWFGLARFALTLVNNKYQSYIESDFHDCFNITNQDFITNGLTTDCSTLDIIKDRLTNFFSTQSFLSSDLQKIQADLSTLGINQDNAYRFICGHTLYALVSKIHEQLVKNLYDAEISLIRKQFNGTLIKERIKQIDTSFSPKFSLETFYTTYPMNDNDEIHQKILNRIRSLK